MEQKELRQWEARCIQEEPPLCRAGCPLNVDARAFTQAMAKGRYQEARAVLERGMPLPQVTASLCEAPCEKICLRGGMGGAIAVGLLERSCLRLSTGRGKVLLLPPRPKNAAVLGAGPSSLVVAFDLSKKGYPVTIYHQGQPGGHLRRIAARLLPPDRLKSELEGLVRSGCIFRQTDAVDLGLFEQVRNQADAVYIGRDDLIAAELLDLTRSPDPATLVVDENGLFTCGAAVDEAPSYILAAARGRQAALSMDRFLQGASLTASRPAPLNGRTDLYTVTERFAVLERTVPADGHDFTEDEAVAEAGRCFDCQCLECVYHCVYLAKFGAYPRVYARQIYNNEAIVKGVHQANILINSCSLCRQCETLCPRDFSMADLCLQARQRMVAEKRMPPSAHAFALDEMRQAVSDRALFIHHAPGQESSSALFFPGCQLSGVRPDQVRSLYDLLLRQPDTGIWLDCCGAPAQWGGRTEEFATHTQELRGRWQKMGRPVILVACSSCLQMFRDHLPEIEAISVWTRIALPIDPPPTGYPALSLTDPCSSRHDKATQQTVRRLVSAIGQELAPLKMDQELTECCGYGGLMANANPAVAAKVIEARAAQSAAPMLTYCIMCREQLARGGKASLHLLDLLLPETARTATAEPVSLSDRRSNREGLKDRLLAEAFHAAPKKEPEPWAAIDLTIPEQVHTTMEDRRILRQDLQRVLYHAERTNSWLEKDNGPDRIAWARLDEVTIWVRYRQDEERYRIVATWSHRMHIQRSRP